MPEQEYSPSRQEELDAERRLSPHEAAMSRALYSIRSHTKDLLEAGITHEQIDKATEIAVNRAKAESEVREKQDPLIRFEEVIRSSAATKEEQEAAEMIIGDIEWARTELRDYAVNHNALDEGGNLLKGKELALKTFRKSIGYGHWRERENQGETSYFYEMNFTSFKGTGGYTKAFMERVLRGIGALKGKQTLEMLRNLPESGSNQPGQPHRSGGDIYDLPTMVEGIKLRTELSDHNVVAGDSWLQLDLNRVDQILEFPET